MFFFFFFSGWISSSSFSCLQIWFRSRKIDKFHQWKDKIFCFISNKLLDLIYIVNRALEKNVIRFRLTRRAVLCLQSKRVFFFFQTGATNQQFRNTNKINFQGYELEKNSCEHEPFCHETWKHWNLLSPPPKSIKETATKTFFKREFSNLHTHKGRTADRWRDSNNFYLVKLYNILAMLYIRACVCVCVCVGN